MLGYLLADLEATCNAIFDDQFSDIIDQIINDNFNPQEVCRAVGAC